MIGEKPGMWPWHPTEVPDVAVRDALTGLRLFMPMWEGVGPAVYDYASQTAVPLINSLGWAATPQGPALNYEPLGSDTPGLTIERDVLGGLGSFTALAVADVNNQLLFNQSLLGRWASGSLALLWRRDSGLKASIQLGTSAGNGGMVSATQIPGVGEFVSVVRWDGATINHFLDGVKDAVSDAHGGTINAVSKYHIGSEDVAGTSQRNWEGLVHLCMAVDWAWPDDLVQYISRRPFALMAQPSRVRYFLPVAAPSGGGSIAAIAAYYHRQRAA